MKSLYVSFGLTGSGAANGQVVRGSRQPDDSLRKVRAPTRGVVGWSLGWYVSWVLADSCVEIMVLIGALKLWC